MNIPPIDPPNPQQTDAAAGSVFTGERKGMTYERPRWGGRFSRPDVILLGALAFIGVVVLVLTLVL